MFRQKLVLKLLNWLLNLTLRAFWGGRFDFFFNLFLISQKRLGILTWNFQPMNKIYLGIFWQIFESTPFMVDDVSTFCVTWLEQKITFIALPKTVIKPVLLIKWKWNFAKYLILDWITFPQNFMRSRDQLWILWTRPFRGGAVFGGFEP